VADDFHVQAGGAAGDLPADAAQADDTQGFAGQLRADEFGSFPFALADADVCGGDVPGQGQEHGDGVLGGADGGAAGGVQCPDTAASGGGDVDVVHTDAGANNGLEPAGILQQFGGEARAAAHDHPLGGLQGLLESGTG